MPDDAFAALAAAVALLRWYAGASPETVVSVAPRPAGGRAGGRRAGAVAVVLLAAAAALLLSGCRSPEQRLIDRRHELREIVDRLHAAYQASERTGDGGGQAEEAEGGGGPLGRLVAEMGRAHFEGYCLAVGRGERPLSLSSRLDAFVREPGNARACERAARLEAEIAELERELGRR
ncbi:MAG TPA: hypothetical protein VLS93_18705 [Anaeromyxobacteraceae bacterium]|nr:hypothetical protein [Anaeromyxobacteraceae bacterium]